MNQETPEHIFSHLTDDGDGIFSYKAILATRLWYKVDSEGYWYWTPYNPFEALDQDQRDAHFWIKCPELTVSSGLWAGGTVAIMN